MYPIVSEYFENTQFRYTIPYTLKPYAGYIKRYFDYKINDVIDKKIHGTAINIFEKTIDWCLHFFSIYKEFESFKKKVMLNEEIAGEICNTLGIKREVKVFYDENYLRKVSLSEEKKIGSLSAYILRGELETIKYLYIGGKRVIFYDSEKKFYYPIFGKEGTVTGVSVHADPKNENLLTITESYGNIENVWKVKLNGSSRYYVPEENQLRKSNFYVAKKVI